MMLRTKAVAPVRSGSALDFLPRTVATAIELREPAAAVAAALPARPQSPLRSRGSRIRSFRSEHFLRAFTIDGVVIFPIEIADRIDDLAFFFRHGTEPRIGRLD